MPESSAINQDITSVKSPFAGIPGDEFRRLIATNNSDELMELISEQNRWALDQIANGNMELIKKHA